MEFPVIYHTNYGGFGFKDEHVQEYNRRTGGNWTASQLWRRTEEMRYDPVMAAVVQEMPVRHHLHVQWHPVKYRDYVIIDEYDGVENVRINVNLYLLDEIAKVLVAPDMDDTQRCWRINELVQQKEEQ